MQSEQVSRQVMGYMVCLREGEEWTDKWVVDGLEGWWRCVWSWVRKCGWTDGRVSSPPSGQKIPTVSSISCIRKKVVHRVTFQDLGFPGCKVFLLWPKIFGPLREINSDPHLGFWVGLGEAGVSPEIPQKIIFCVAIPETADSGPGVEQRLQHFAAERWVTGGRERPRRDTLQDTSCLGER